MNIEEDFDIENSCTTKVITLGDYILPHLMSYYLIANQPESGYSFYKHDGFSTQTERFITILYEFLDFSLNFFDISLDPQKYNNLPDDFLEKIKSKGELLELLCSLKSQVSIQNIQYLKKLVYILSLMLAKPVQFNNKMPTEYLEDFTKEFLSGMKNLSKESKIPLIYEKAKEIKFVSNNLEALSVVDDYYRKMVVDPFHRTGAGRIELIFKLLNIDRKFSEMFEELLNISFIKAPFVERIVFERCNFITPITVETNVNTDIVIRNSIINQAIEFNSHFIGSVSFENLQINDEFTLKECVFNKSFTIRDCIFYDKSMCLIEDVMSVGNDSKVSMYDNEFYGDVYFSHISWKKTEVYLDHLLFFRNLNVNKVSIGENSTLKNLAAVDGIDHKALIIKNTKTKPNNKVESPEKSEPVVEIAEMFDISGFHIACDTGFLKPTFAAKYLGKGINFLAQKRMRDRKQVTPDSIPFIGEGKSIVYPKEALDAYLRHDFKRLKEIRKEYGFTYSED